MGFFQEIYDRMDALEDKILEVQAIMKNVDTRQGERLDTLRQCFDRESYQQKDVIKYQQKTIDSLISALCEKYSSGYFCFSPDADWSEPTVIHNGENLTTGAVTRVTVDWEKGFKPIIDIRHEGKTE